MLPKIIFCGTVQNCAQYLSESLKNIEEMAEKASESAYIFVENDSTDNSKKCIYVNMLLLIYNIYLKMFNYQFFFMSYKKIE